MKNNIKKLVALFVVVAAFCALTVTASAFTDAKAVTYDKVYYDSITAADNDDYYSFSLDSYSKVTIGITTTIRPYTLTVYDAEKKQVWTETVSKGFFETVTDDSRIIQKEFDKGEYFLKVSSTSAGKYNLKLTTAPAKKAPVETDPDENNSIAAAKVIELGKTVTGKLLKEKEKDYFKFVIPSAGSLDLKVVSKMRYYSAVLYMENADKTTTKIWSDDKNEWDSSKKTREDSYKLELSEGTYYLEINGFKTIGNERYVATGSYEFFTAFASAKVNETEPNGSIVEARKINLNKTYKGHLSITDNKDFYEITVKEGKLAIGFVSNMSSYNIYLYDELGTVKWSSKGNSKAADQEARADLHKMDVAAGKYYIRVDGGNGKYSFKLEQNVDLAKVSGLKYSRSVTYVTLKWSKVSGANGYEIFKYDDAEKKYVKVGATSKTSIKIKNLDGGTEYKFKVKAYKKINSAYAYGEESDEFIAITTPRKAKIASVKAGDKGSKQVTVKWNQVKGADGYRIYYSLDSDFETVKTVTVKPGDTVEKTIKKLKKGRKYYFRVRAFKKVNGKNVWGKYSNVKSVKVK